MWDLVVPHEPHDVSGRKDMLTSIRFKDDIHGCFDSMDVWTQIRSVAHPALMYRADWDETRCVEEAAIAGLVRQPSVWVSGQIDGTGAATRKRGYRLTVWK
jgi:hypothetical protein